MTYGDITLETDGAIAVITLNRPDKLNAYTARMGAELEDAITRASADDAIRVVILTGAGRGFCAGADISAGADSFDTRPGGAGAGNFGDGTAGQPRRGAGFVSAMFNCAKPIITAFNGAAVGVGLTLTLPTDIRIAADTAKFGFVFTRRGLTPEAGSAWFLPKLVGLPQALRWCLSGRVFGADEALAGGLVSEVVPADHLMVRAREIAQEIAENCAPVAIAMTRQMLWRFSGDDSPEPCLSVDGAFAMALGASPDVREGVAAFIEKRSPQFPGRASADTPAGYPWWKD